MEIKDFAGLVMFCIVSGMLVGVALGSYYNLFNAPSCKIWESDRTYDHILIGDYVVCNPINNTTYWRYDVANYNGTEYLLSKTKVDNSTVKDLVVCR